MSSSDVEINEWVDAGHAQQFLDRRDNLTQLELIGTKPGEDDPSNQSLDVETQLRWLREIGFVEVECFWKWRELALFAGQKPV